MTDVAVGARLRAIEIGSRFESRPYSTVRFFGAGLGPRTETMKALELKIPPVVQFLVVFALMWLLAKYLPALSAGIPARRILVVLFFCLGGIVAVPAVAAFRSSGTTVDPRSPEKATQLVVSGVYRYSRNPMYLGLLCLLIAWATYLSNLLAFAWIPLFIGMMNHLQIQPEEEAMEKQFGQKYRDYRKSVRRWI